MTLCLGPDGSLTLCLGTDGSVTLCLGPDGSVTLCLGTDGSVTLCLGTEGSLTLCVGTDGSFCLGPDGSLTLCQGSKMHAVVNKCVCAHTHAGMGACTHSQPYTLSIYMLTNRTTTKISDMIIVKRSNS